MADLITFPPGVLSPEPVRLPVLGRGDGWFAIDKPAGLVLAADALHAEDAANIVAAIHTAALAGKPQLAGLGIGGCSRIHALDAEVSGAAVLASSEAAAAVLRNDLGTGRWEFSYDLVTEAGDQPDEVTCNLPLIADASRPRMIVSHRAGKRARTVFVRRQRLGRHALWTAITAENRPHQVRLHAAECGLRIVGETLYARVAAVRLSSLKRGYRPGREGERPLHPGLALHLGSVSATSPARHVFTVHAPRPKSLAALIQRLADRA